MRRRRSVPEVVHSHFSRQKASGKSIADYCRENNICASTFYGWNKRYKKKESSEKPSPSTSSFIEIPLRSSPQLLSSRIRVTRTEIEFPPETANNILEVLTGLLSRNRETH